MEPEIKTAQLMKEGDNFLKKLDFRQAVNKYTEAIELDTYPPSGGLSEASVVYHKRGWAKAHLGDIKGELDDWNKAIELNPQFAQGYADRAIAKITLKDEQGAIADIKKALELNPELKNVLEPILKNVIAKNEATKQSSEKQEDDVIAKGEISDEVKKMMGPDRREFLKQVALVGTGTVAALSLPGCSPAVLAGKKTDIRWGMIIDLKRCVGCYACTIACKAENHTPPGVAYNVVLEKELGDYPNVKRTFLPRPCMQCENSSCVTVCPVSATYRREDGITVVDYDKCIGCRYCIAACPYGARSYDFGYNYTDDISNPWEKEPSPEYGQYRKREKHSSPVGNVRKCTFCLHRIYNGLPPACAATCMGNAIHFGNLADPNAKCMAHGENLQELLRTRNYMRLKEELGNEPRVWYLT